ncbi:hypothetical protein FACS18942_06070 [Planctomycetales bacterium]|nr:hypothetical protein FACS18942_06070 [Planctomycetales bacterium]GHT35196.1 hypothetical protein FACS189427_03960 [Planctomycetales bacterium]
MRRYFITFITFLTVTGLYFLYGWVFVPLVLPSNSIIAQQNKNVVPQSGEPREEMLPYIGLFGKDAWERSPKIEMLRSGETIILFLNQEIKGNKAVLKPCTILFLSENTEKSSEERVRQSIVMHTQEYAEIEFDGELNFSKFPLPKMTGGKLYGKVIIQSDLEKKEIDDDLFIETHNIAFADSPQATVISTIYDVIFRMGNNTGKGTELQLTLSPLDAKNPKSAKTLNSVQFKKLDYLNLCFEDKKEVGNERKTETKLVAAPQPEAASAFKPLAKNAAANGNSVSAELTNIPLTARNPFTQTGTTNLSMQSDTGTLLNIKCRREFILNTIPLKNGKNAQENGWLAEFRGEAVIERTIQSGLKENISGEIIQVRFAPKPAAQTAPQQGNRDGSKGNKDNPLEGLEPIEFLALGQLAQGGLPNKPARLFSPRNGGVTMRGDRILYDIKKNFFTLETDIKPGSMPQVHINLQNRYDIYGEKGFQYKIPPDGSFGTLVSGGKGSFSGNTGDASRPQKITASWNQIQMEPYPLDPSQIQIQLTGNVQITAEGFGRMTADKIDLWCRSGSQKSNAGNVTVKRNGTSNPMTGNPFESSGDLIPDRGTATGNVHFENESGTCDVKQLQCFFQDENNQAKQSRWIPQLLTQPKPQLKSQPENSIQQVQYQQPQRTPVKPLYVASAQPLAPQTGSMNVISPVVLPPIAQGILPQNAVSQPLTSSNVSVQPQYNNTAVNNTATGNRGSRQNLIGFNSSDSRSKFSVFADRMMMIIHLEDKQSQNKNTKGQQETGGTSVQRIWLGGSVHIIEKVTDLSSNGLFDIHSSEIEIWNPSALNTVIRITGKLPSEEVVFKGRGIQMNTMNVEIFRAENLMWVNSPGRLFTAANGQNKHPFGKSETETAAPHINAANSVNSAGLLIPMQPLLPNSDTLEQDNRLVIEWNETMKFNGQSMTFTGKQDRNGGRVQAYYQQQKMFCDLMQIHFNRIVQIFDDNNKEEPEAEMIDCAVNVNIENRQLDENRQLKSYDRGCFDAVRVYLKSNDFVARGPGFLRSTSLKSGNSFAEKMNTGTVPGNTFSNSKATAGNGEQLSFLCVWFQDYIRGNFYGNQKRAEVAGRVQVVYCPVRGWDEIYEIDQISAAARLGYYMQCERLEIVEMPDIPAGRNSAPALSNKTGSLELTAQGNTASIEGNSFYGKAEMIKYNQAKNLFILDGKAWVKSGQRELPAERIEYNIETGALNTSSVNGLTIGQ